VYRDLPAATLPVSGQGGVVVEPQAMRKIRREAVLPVPLDRAWEAITDSGRISEWFGCRVDLEARPGSEAEFRWPDGKVRRAVVEVVDQPRRFVFRWEPESVSDPRRDPAKSLDAPPSRVEFILYETSAGTRVVVVESLIADLFGFPNPTVGSAGILATLR
jgi:uncharacterized protein YndB with AHSA1/START domain